MNKSESYIFRAQDWDNEVEDVFIVLFGNICWVKGFEDNE